MVRWSYVAVVMPCALAVATPACERGPAWVLWAQIQKGHTRMVSGMSWRGTKTFPNVVVPRQRMLRARVKRFPGFGVMWLIRSILRSQRYDHLPYEQRRRDRPAAS